MAQFKAELGGQPLYPALVQQGVIPYDIQVQLEQAAQAAPDARPGGLPGSTLRHRTGPVPVLGVPPPKLGAAPPAAPLVAPPASGSGRLPSMPKPPALSGLAAPAPCAPLVPPPAGLVPPPKLPGGSFIPPPKLPGGGMIPPPKLPGAGIPPPKLPGGPVVPAPRVSITPA
ncbi:MAG: hypothetical protein KIS92_22380, partial [Planctomycetota bacterium]|nr:hypothetical protein [Planctomycetota bacterium]